MKTLKIIIFILISQQIFSQSCEKALSTEIYYEIDGQDWKLTPLHTKDKFRSFILQTESWNFAREFSMIRSDQESNHELILVPLDNKHQYYVGFDKCEEDCNGYYRFKEMTLYEGSNLDLIDSGNLICYD